jgi:hypothetical protein
MELENLLHDQDPGSERSVAHEAVRPARRSRERNDTSFLPYGLRRMLQEREGHTRRGPQPAPLRLRKSC